MIIKNTPQTLDKSSDYRLIPNTAMIDALNVLIDSDNTMGPNSGEHSLGDSGVIKNIFGNQAVQESTAMWQSLKATQDEFFNASNIEGDGQVVKIIGSVVDKKLRLAYLFVWSNLITKHAVLVYDPYGKLPNVGFTQGGELDSIGDVGYPGLKMLHMSSKFNFPEHGFVKADIVYTANSFMLEDAIAGLDPNEIEWFTDSRKRDFEKDVLLYFTDNKNEPRKLNVFKCLFKDIANYSQTDLIDFITACPKTPLTPIEYTFVNENEIPVAFRKGIDESYFKRSPGFQFAYQYIYDDGMETAISPYSDIAFPPSVLQQGTSTSPDHDQFNVCALSLPIPGREISRVRIVARQGNGPGNVGRFFIIDEFNPNEDKQYYYRAAFREYYFRNDQVLKGVSEEEVNKQFDSVPRKAEAQSLHSNRLMYGNYLDGFDNVETSCTYDIQYEERPLEGISGTVSFRTSIYEVGARNNSYPTAEQNYAGQSQGTTGYANFNGGDDSLNTTFDPVLAPIIEGVSSAKNKSVGVRVDLTGLPQDVAAGTLITITISISPNKNYHIFDARNSYSQSLHLGERDAHDHGTVEAAGLQEFEFDDDGNLENTPEIFIAQNNSTIEPKANSTLEDRLEDFHTAKESGAVFLKSDNSTTNPTSSVESGGSSYFGLNYGVGNSSTNADGCPFDIKWRYVDDNGVEQQETALYGTSAANPLIIRGETLSFTAKFRFTSDVEGVARNLLASAIEDAFCFGSVDSTGTGNVAYAIELVEPPQRIATLQYDLGLSDYQSIPVGSSRANLICGVQGLPEDSQPKSMIPPQGYFIVNKINAEFRFVHPRYPQESSEQNANLILTMGKINDLEVMTCVKPIIDEFEKTPWRVISKNTMQQYFTNPEIFFPASEDVDSPLNLQGYKYKSTNSTKDFYIMQSDIPDSEKNHMQNQNFLNHIEALGPHKCFGYLDVHSSHRNFVRTLSESDLNPLPTGPPFNPGTGAFQAKRLFPTFSLLDGQGGPGGAAQGNNLAFDNEGVGNRGSVYGSNRLDDNLKIYNGNQTNGWNPYQEYANDTYIQYYAGSCGFTLRIHGLDEDGEYPSKTENALFTLSPVGEGATNAINHSHKIHISYYVGPFFTGDIRYQNKDREVYHREDPFGATVLPLVTWNIGNLPLEEERKSCYRLPRILNGNNLSKFQRTVFVGEEYNPEALSEAAIPSLTFAPKHSHIVSVGGGSGFVSEGLVGAGLRSFKTKANHEFGIVYYDQRGRHGFVNPLTSVYVPGYSDEERGQEKGKVNIQLNLLHDPPSWATNYKIVYTKNTSIDKFVQYSAGGAFVAFEDEVAAENDANIYVSLNYLQHHPISYVSSFGARPPEGGLDLYRYQVGDILRVVSYALPVAPGPGVTAAEEGARVYPRDYEFEVVDYVLLDVDKNPLSNPNASTQPEDPELGDQSLPLVQDRHKGAFVVLKNNNDADGFNYNDVRDNTHLWGDNCIFEIVSPKKQSDEEDKLYYEISETFDIVLDEDNNRVHEVTEILIDKGDVFFRPYAVNARALVPDPETLPETNTASAQGFKDLIVNASADQVFGGSKSRFRTFFLETESANDLFRSDSSLIGRPNVYLPDAVEVIREATITYSDLSNPSSRKVNYSSFNASLANFKDLPQKHGDIHYMVEQDDGLFVIQTNKCSKVPVGRNLIQSASQTGILTSTTAVLGTEFFYAGTAGCDFNPESVTVIDNSIYFAHKHLGKVFRFTEGVGVEDISAIKMGGFFRRVFKRVMDASQFVNSDDVRVIGGYDPDKKEYIISISRPDNSGPVNSVFGCTDPEAENFNQDATVDDGSCLYLPQEEPVLGCTNPEAINYNSLATVDDGSCILPILGCTDPDADNFDPTANVDDGSCFYSGGGDDTDDDSEGGGDDTGGDDTGGDDTGGDDTGGGGTDPVNPSNPNIGDIGPVVNTKDKRK